MTLGPSSKERKTSLLRHFYDICLWLVDTTARSAPPFQPLL